MTTSLSEAQLRQRREAAPRGGKALVNKYGAAYMRHLASLGGRAFWNKYKVVPMGTSDLAIVDRATGKPTGATLNGRYFRNGQEQEASA